MNKDEALQMCLEYIETDAHERKYVRHAIKQALAAPTVQEPVAWDVFNGICHHSTHGTESSAKAMAAEMQKNHDLSGSIAAFRVKHRMLTPPAAQQEPVAWRLNGESSLGHGKVFGEWKSGKPPKDVADLASVDKNWSLEFAYTTPPAAPVQPVSGVVLRDGYPTLIQDKHIKETDQRLCILPNTPSAAPVQKKVLGFGVVLNESLPPNAMKFVQPAPEKGQP